MNRSSLGHRSARRQRGLSIVELLVGVAIGLFIVGGAIKLMVDNLISNKNMVLETRVNQDLRAAADLIARDLRRAGYWRSAPSGVFSAGAPTVIANPYAGIGFDGTNDDVTYAFSRDADSAISDAESSGFRVRNGVLQMLRSTVATANWQPLTDPNTVSIPDNGFEITQTERVVDLYRYCQCRVTLSCAESLFQVGGANYATRPRLTVRSYEILIRGTSATDARVTREVRETVRVRNDVLDGTCPAA
jgi:prepilin peptidase dependent protein B